MLVHVIKGNVEPVVRYPIAPTQEVVKDAGSLHNQVDCLRLCDDGLSENTPLGDQDAKRIFNYASRPAETVVEDLSGLVQVGTVA